MPRSPFSLQGKNVCIIGAGGLIGRPTVEAALALGAGVFGGGRSEVVCEHPAFRFFSLDIAREESIREFARRVVETGGGIDAWINCAWPRVDYSELAVESIKTDEMLQDLKAHLLGFYNCCRWALVRMKQQGYGSIVNCGSIYGELAPDPRVYQGTEIRSIPTYALIKAGIHGLSRYLAGVAAAHNVRVNCVAPGGILNQHSQRFQTQYANRVPLGRMARPEDVVGPLLFLASDASCYITGQVLLVDGGLSAW